MTRNRRPQVRDVLSEVIAGLTQKPARTVLTAVGTVLAVATFVVIIGVATTAASQIDRRFTLLAATEVIVEDVGRAGLARSELSFGDDASAKIKALNGVLNAGLWWPVSLSETGITAVPGVDTKQRKLGVFAAEDGALQAMRPTMNRGRLYDQFHNARAERVAVLGFAAAHALGVGQLDGQQAVYINDRPYTIVGVIADLERMPELLNSVIIPTQTALADYGPPFDHRAKMLIETKVGAARLIASQAPIALRPDAPERFKVFAETEPKVLRRQIVDDLNSLFLVLAGISLVVGIVGIANTTLIGVMERTAEIGLRRTVGARPRHIAAQFLSEAASVGLLGGLVGTTMGVMTVVTVALVKDWSAAVPSWTVLTGPALGVGAGILAGIYPALRAARIEPVEALRR